MVSSPDGGEWGRPAHDPQGRYVPLAVDDQGRLVVVGGGAEPSATGLRIRDGVEPDEATVLANRLLVADQHDQPLTDAQLRAAPVEVDTGLTTQTDALTDAELRAAPVPVATGLSPLTDTQLRAAPVPVQQATQPLPTGASTEATLAQVLTGVDGVEGGLASLLAAVDGLEGLAATLNGLVTTVRDTVYRRTDPLPTGGAIIGYVADAFARYVEEGKTFMAGARLALAAGQTGTFSLVNPTGSGKTLYLTGLELAADMNADATLVINPATTPGAAQAATNQHQAFSTVASAQVKAGVGAPTGGTAMSTVLRLPANQPVLRQQLLILPAGKSLAVSAAPSTLAASVLYASFRWLEAS